MFIPTPSGSSPVTDYETLAQVVAVIGALGAGLTYLVRLGQLISKLDRLHSDMERVQAAHEKYARTAAEHAVEIEALRRDVNRLLDAPS